MKRPVVCISYAKPDQRFASRIERELMRMDVDVRVMPFVAGEDDWAKTIRRAVSPSDLVVFIVSPAPTVLTALGAVRVFGKPVLAILPDRLRHSSAEPFRAISQWQLIDGVAETPTEIAEAILDAVSHVKLESA